LANSVHRRGFLKGALGLGAAGLTLGLGPTGRRALALGDRARLQMGQLVYDGGEWNPRPTALRRLAWEVEKRTSIEVKIDPVNLRPTDPKLHEHPFLYMAGDREFPPWSEADTLALRRYLTLGGLLVIDSAQHEDGAGFDASVRREIGQLFPRLRPSRLAERHVLYKSFYLLSRPSGRVSQVGYLDTLEQDRRVMLAYCMNDLGGAWDRDDYGRYRFECTPGGDTQREHAFRLGINLVMYALCLDYKDDQVHVPFILRRRRWRTDD
jgi:hypothetical protein